MKRQTGIKSKEAATICTQKWKVFRMILNRLCYNSCSQNTWYFYTSHAFIKTTHRSGLRIIESCLLFVCYKTTHQPSIGGTIRCKIKCMYVSKIDIVAMMNNLLIDSVFDHWVFSSAVFILWSNQRKFGYSCLQNEFIIT